MIRLALIGIGTGNPDHLTRAAVDAMNAADLILLPRKDARTAELIDLRRSICGTVLTGATRVVEFDLPTRAATPDYRSDVDAWHDAIAAAWSAEIDAHLPDGGALALLVWGDPALYDSTLRIAERLRAAGRALDLRVIPGITSIQALTAAHAIPLNTLAAPVTITTGRQLRDHGWPSGAVSVVVMLDAGCAFEALAPHGVDIWWGAYLGLPQQALVHGPLATAGPKIAEKRAALRARHGWIMDIYLLRREAHVGAGQ